MTSLAEVARELRAIGAAPGATRDARAMPLRPDGIDYGSLLRRWLKARCDRSLRLPRRRQPGGFHEAAAEVFSSVAHS